MKDVSTFNHWGVEIVTLQELAGPDYLGLLQRDEWAYLRPILQCSQGGLNFNCSRDMVGVVL